MQKKPERVAGNETPQLHENEAVEAESPNENDSQPAPGELVPQKGGRGAIRHGSTKGNTPGAGSPAKFFREMCREGLYRAKTVDTLVAIISGDIHERIGTDKDTGEPIYGETKNSDRIKAAAFLTQYAYGLPKATIEVDDKRKGSMTPAELLQAIVDMKRNLEELARPAPQRQLPPGEP